MATGRESAVAQRAHHGDRRRVLLVGAVRKVDAGDVEPRLHERANDALGGRCRTERADDLRAWNRRGQDQVREWERRRMAKSLTAPRRGRVIGRARRVIHKSSGG